MPTMTRQWQSRGAVALAEEDERLRQAEQGQTGDVSPLLLAALAQGRMAGAQRRAAVQGIGQNFGNRQAARMVAAIQRDDDDEDSQNKDQLPATDTSAEQTTGDTDNQNTNTDDKTQNTDSGTDQNTGDADNRGTDNSDNQSADTGDTTGEQTPGGAENQGTDADTTDDADADGDVAAVEPVSGDFEDDSQITVSGAVPNVNVQGKTTASYSHSFKTLNLKTEQGEGCKGCGKKDCVHVTGSLEETFSVATSVRLPNPPAGLTKCQTEAVQNAINTTLAAHEQDHVKAFETFNGTETSAIDETLCNAQFAPLIQGRHAANEKTREAASNALSKALDPFNFTIDGLDCEDAPPKK